MRIQVFFATLTLFAMLNRSATAIGEQAADKPLRLVRIDMDVSGIGQFTFEGNVSPGETFSYSVPLDEVSDVLRNLEIDDSENSIQFARVSSLFGDEKASLPLPAMNTFGELLISMRGEQVEVFQTDEKTISGRIISVERQRIENGSGPSPILLTLATSKGIQCLSLDRIKMLTPIRAEMNAKLDAVLNQHVAEKDEEYREVELGFAGSKPRHVSIRLTRPLPVWRTTYSFSNSKLEQRIVFDNSTREEWKNISILFTDRSPFVFQTPLYQATRFASDHQPNAVSIACGSVDGL